MDGESEGLLDEWDNDFIQELCSFIDNQESSTQAPKPPLPPRPDSSFSPPRELSQRTHDPGTVVDSFEHYAPRAHGDSFSKDQEIDRLKKELGLVSEQLNLLKKECSELRKERDEEVQLTVIPARFKAKEAEFNREIDSTAAPGTSRKYGTSNSVNKVVDSWTKSCNSVGIQTDFTTESNSLPSKNVYRGSEKLLGLWKSNEQNFGKDLVAKLLVTCEEEFHILFGYLGSNFPLKAKMNGPQKATDLSLSNQLHPAHPLETAKVSHLYSMLTKISNGTSKLEDLIDALTDLCSLNNVSLLNGSLRVLRKILSNSFVMDKELGKASCTRENLIIEKSFSKKGKSIMNGSSHSENRGLFFADIAETLNHCHIPHELKLSTITTGRSGFLDSSSTAISGAYSVSLFENMCQIATTSTEAEIRCEALAIMNLILMRCNAYLERDRFAGELVFQCLSKALRRESGFFVQDEALHTLYLLCNCPKVMSMVTSCFNANSDAACSEDINERSIPTFQGLNEIFTGLADCVDCHGSGTAAEMKLRRNAVIFLAFLGSSGKSGVEILLNHRLPKDTNLLAMLLRSLVSDLELKPLKSADSTQLSDAAREQVLLVREALIFFNRLVSHPQYAVPVLQVLTSTREMASMTVDLAHRLTSEGKFRWNNESTTKQIRESEIIGLARVFKRRVFTFLGDSIS